MFTLRSLRFAPWLLALVTSVSGCASHPPPLSLSHAWIVVPTGATERTLLEGAGFRIAPDINRHDGQGTASITVEFQNGFLELIYPDPTVPISPASQAGAEKFRLKSTWRESGYSPIGIVFDRTPATPETFPFATWKISADWMGSGKFMEMLTPKETPKSISLSISSHAGSAGATYAAFGRDPEKKAMFEHPSGARRLTGIRVVAPAATSLPPAAAYLGRHRLLKFEVGSQWLLDVTLDKARQGITKDLQPGLPLVVHY